MQGAEDEVEESVLSYVTETEFRKQRSRSPSCNSLMRGMDQKKLRLRGGEADQPELSLLDGDDG